MFELMFWTGRAALDFYTQDGTKKYQDYFDSEEEALEYADLIAEQVYHEYNNLTDITIQNIMTGEIFMWDFILDKSI